MNEQTVSNPVNALQHISDDQFSLAVHQAAETMNRPEFNGRLARAVDLVAAGAVSACMKMVRLPSNLAPTHTTSNPTAPARTPSTEKATASTSWPCGC